MVSGWQQLSGEPADAYALFVMYRETPADERSLTALGADLGRDVNLFAAPPDLAALAERHCWYERAALWDEAQKSPDDKRRDMHERHTRAALAMQQKVVDRLRQMGSGELTPAEVARWFAVASEVESRSRPADDRAKLKDHAREFVRLALADPEAAALAASLFALLAPRLALAGGLGMVGDAAVVDAGAAPRTSEPPTA